MNADVLDVSLSRWGRPLIQLNNEVFLALFKGQRAEEVTLATGDRILRLRVGEDPEAVTFIMSEKIPRGKEPGPRIVTV